MKKNLLFAIFLIAAITAFSQKIPFQGKLIETGTPVNGTRTLEFSIASQSWSEIHADVAITDGLYFVVLGSITPLPDSLFYGTDEQTLDISVDGTALSPVVLFKPLSTPYEGNEVNVRNTDGTVVGTLKARTDTVKHGEFSILGENSGTIEAGFYKAPDEAETDMPYVGLQKDSAYLVSISTRKNGTSLNGSLYLGSNFDESISHNQKGWFAFKDSVHTGQFQSQNWGGLGASGYLAINGTNTINVNISSRHWENPNLPWMKLIGSDNQDVIQMSAENDDNESGNIKILSKNGNSTYLSANGISSGNSSTQYYEFTTQDWGGQGHTGLFKLNGTSTQNFELTSQSWVNPNFPWFKLSGENLGDAVQIFLDNDGSEAANLNLFSLGRGSSSFTTDSWNMDGPNSSNIHIGVRDWEGKPDLPIINLFGEGGFHATEFSVFSDGNGYQHGFLNIKSSDGRTAELNPNILAFHNNAGSQTVVLETLDQGQGEFGALSLIGPIWSNVYIGAQQNPDLPWITLQGTDGHEAMQIGCVDDTSERGFIKMVNKDTGEEMFYSSDGVGGNTTFGIGNDVYVNGSLTVTGTITPSSDKRFKKNIRSLEGSSLQKIELIKGVSYNWRQDEFPEKNFSSDKQIGVIAQDLEAQFPALVKTDKDGYKSVNYNGFTAVLLEAVKELNAKVEKLETENLQLKAELTAAANNSSEINQLKQQMEMLTKMVQQNSTVESSAVNEIVSTPGLN